MKSKTKVVVLCGGNSAEAQVSRKSGACVAEALQANYANVEVLDCRPFDLPRRLQLSKPDVVFSMLHGGVGEDGTVSALLTLLGIRFVGSGVAASALAMDKRLAKIHFRAADLPVLPDIACNAGDDVSQVARQAVEEFPEGGVVKATNQGSAIGLSFCETTDQFESGIRQALSYGSSALIERRFRGREITVAILEDPDLCALPPVEILIPAGSHFDYYHRYTEGASTHLCPAPLEPTIRSRVEDVAIRAHRVLGCRHYSRVDMLISDAGEVALLELNSIPGMTKTSLYPDAARAASISYEDLVQCLVERALATT